MSSAKGSRIFAGDKRKKNIIRILTISLMALGIAIGALFVYQQLAKDSYYYPTEKSTLLPFSVSKEEAIRIALDEVDKEPDRDAYLLPNEQASAKLIHVTGDGIGFTVPDENSLADMWMFDKEHKFREEYRNSYLWDVHVTTSTSDSGGGSRGYSYMIDADSGQVIGNDRDYAYFEPSR